MKTIYAQDIDFNYEAGTGGDAGLGFTARCPDCGDTCINVAEHQWWESICSCGLNWRLSISVVAEKEEVENNTAE